MEVSLTTEAEELVKEPVLHPEPTEDTPQENYESEDTSVVQEPAGEYHEVIGDATHAPEDENDYEGTNTGDEDESAKSDRLDADQLHDITAEVTDATATVTGQKSEFGGEQTEYLDYVQPEEYDERYGEDLPERASPVPYGERPHYEEGGQDTSTAVDETQTILPGSEEDDEVNSAATPIPASAVLELADDNATNDSVSRTSIHFVASPILLIYPRTPS